MSYFNPFPYISYQFPDNISRLYKNLSIRPDVVEALLGDTTNLDVYYVESGETPETIAFDAYGDENMHWVIMLTNRVMNLYLDWPMSDQMLNDYMYQKYRVQMDLEGIERTLDDNQVYEFISFVGAPTNGFSSHINLQDSDNSPKVAIRPSHFVDEEDNIYSYDTAFVTADAFGRPTDLPTLIPVSYETYEVNLNDEKKKIYLPSATIAMKMKAQFGRIVNG